VIALKTITNDSRKAHSAEEVHGIHMQHNTKPFLCNVIKNMLIQLQIYFVLPRSLIFISIKCLGCISKCDPFLKDA
jgi:hypothetical protein